MNIRTTIVVSSLLVLATAPLASHASDADEAVNACVKAFVENHLPKDRVVSVRTEGSPGPVNRFARQTPSVTIALTAQGAKSGVVLAQARCVTNARGDVIVLDSPPLEGYTAKADDAVVTR